MKQPFALAMVITLAIISTACTSTFLVSKNGKGYYLGSGSNAAFRMFCESGDLKKILSETQLSQSIKDDLFLYNCGPERSKEKVTHIYASMTPDQRKELRMAFKQNGYDINYLPC